MGRQFYFNIHNPKGYLTELRLDLTYLKYLKYKHHFIYTVTLLCSCDKSSMVLSISISEFNVAPKLIWLFKAESDK